MLAVCGMVTLPAIVLVLPSTVHIPALYTDNYYGIPSSFFYPTVAMA